MLLVAKQSVFSIECLLWWKVITHDAGSDSYQANSLILFEQEPCKHSLAIFFLHLHQQLELLL